MARSMILVIPIGEGSVGQVQVLVVDLAPAEVYARLQAEFSDVVVPQTPPAAVPEAQRRGHRA